MKKILIIVLTLLMLFSCIACSNTPDNNSSSPDKNGNSSLLAGSKHPLTSETPMEQRPPVAQAGGMDASGKKAFEKNDPRKKYLEEKYGVTAYLVSEKQPGSIYSIFALEGYEGTFQLFAKEDLIAIGTPEENITTDYTDNAYFTVAYVEIYEYFAQAIEASGVTVDRMIIEQKTGNVNPYDPHKSFTECLASARNGAKRFHLVIYGDFDRDDNAIGKLLMALDKLDFTGQVEFRHVLKDISKVTNTELLHDAASFYSQFTDRQQIK